MVLAMTLVDAWFSQHCTVCQLCFTFSTKGLMIHL